MRFVLLFFLILFRFVTFFIHIQLCVQLRKASRLFSQFFFLWEWLFHFDLRRFLLLF